MEREGSSKESDALERSTKKFKENHCVEEKHSGNSRTETNAVRSYKDKLVGDIPGAYEQAFGFEATIEEETESDYEESSLFGGMVAISLSKKEKARIREPWGQAIIVKTFGKKVGFLFLSYLEVVLEGAPWFVCQHFLAIRKWEPEFKVEEASLSFVAVWIRLLGLSIEFHDPITSRILGEPLDQYCALILIQLMVLGAILLDYVYRSTDSANMNNPPSNALKNPCSAKPLEGDHSDIPLKDSDSTTLEKVMELEASVYDEWMVVTCRKNPNGNGKIIPRGSIKDESWGVKGFSYKYSGKAPKPNHRMETKQMAPVVNPVVNHTLGWEQSKWPPKPLVTPNSIFSFGAGTSGNEASRLAVGDLAKGKNNPSWEINNKRDPKGPDGDYGMVHCKRDGGMEEYLPFNRGQCSLGFPSAEGKSVDHHTELVLALLNGSAKIPPFNIPTARELMLATQISDCLEGNLLGSKTLGKALAVLDPIYSTHSGYMQQSRLSKMGRKYPASQTWRACKEGGVIFNKGLKWSISNGEIVNAWDDFWLASGSLRKQIQGPLVEGEGNLSVKDFLSEGVNISFVLLDLIMQEIRGIPLASNPTHEDIFIWDFSKDGSFFLNSAYMLAKGLNPLNLATPKLWV
nr:hypothetical protein CFP56_63319 [Quercus suber]